MKNLYVRKLDTMKLKFITEINFDELRNIQKEQFRIADDSVLVIVDINNGFASGGALYSERVKNIIPDVCNITEQFYKKGLPIIAFTDTHTENSVEFKYYPVHCLKDTRETELIDEL